jgi:TolB-like protein
LFGELRRRNVIRMAGLYLVGAWLVVQVAATLLPVFEAPSWLMKPLVVLLSVGFVPALVIAWVFELTPDGLKRDADVPMAESIAPRTARRMERWILVLLALALAVFVFDRFVLAPRRDAALVAQASQQAATRQGAAKPAAVVAAIDQQSIAVMPFVNMSADKDNAYFSDGLAETLLDMLAQVPTLKVIARTSSFALRDSTVGVREIGRQLNVAHVLEGSVQKSGDMVRITAQLIRASDGVHLWSRRYDRKLTDVFQIQDEIATEVVDSLKVVMASEDRGRLTQRRTDNLQAYDHYLQGRVLARDPARANLLGAVAQFEQAIALDPGFVAPHGSIAQAWVLLADYGGVPNDIAYPRAEKAARRALEIDPQSADALTAMALVRSVWQNDEPGARATFEAALRANPSYVPAYDLYADLLRDSGEVRRMLEMQQRAAELDPLSIYMKSRVANKLMAVGRLDEAGRAIDAMLSADANSDFAIEEAGKLAMHRGRFAQAVERLQRVHFARPGDAFSAAWISMIGMWMRDPPLAERALSAARARGAGNYWELRALAELADWQHKPEQFDVLARQDGAAGAWWRARRATMQGDLPQARMHLLETLRMFHYDATRPVLASQVTTLVELARVERALGLATWQAPLDAASTCLEALAAEGAVYLAGIDSVAYEQARVHALRGERGPALVQLRRAIAQGFARHWFLANDPAFASWRADPEFTALVAGMNTRAAAEKAKLAGKIIAL